MQAFELQKQQQTENQDEFTKKQAKIDQKMQALEAELQLKLDKQMKEITDELDGFQKDAINLKTILSNLKLCQRDNGILQERIKKLHGDIDAI